MGKKFSFKDVDKGMKRIVRELSRSSDPHVDIGIHSDAGQYAQFSEINKVDDVAKKARLDELGLKSRKKLVKFEKGRSHSSSANLADVATFMEFGTRSIPKRPFMKQSFDSNQDRVYNFIQAQHKKVVEGKMTMEMALKRIGVFFEGIVKKHIVNGSFKANKPSTIKMKGSSKPLIDTGRMRQSITNKVVMKPGAE